MKFDVNVIEMRKKLKRINDNRQIRQYYLEKSERGKTYTAIMLDSILIRIILTIVFLFYFIFTTSDFRFSVIMTIQFFILFNLIAYKIKTMRLKKSRIKVNSEIGKEEILKELLNKTPYEFIEYIRNVFDKHRIEDLKIYRQKDIDIIGEYKSHTIGIKCFQYKDDVNVSVKDIREFFLGLNELGVEEGLIVTTSSFNEDVKEFLPKLDKHVKMNIMNIDEFIKIIKKVELYPSETEIKREILNQINGRRYKLKEYRSNVLSKGKTIKYMILSLIIYLWGGVTPYQTYYTIVACLLFTLGIMSMITYAIRRIRKLNTEE